MTPAEQEALLRPFVETTSFAPPRGTVPPPPPKEPDDGDWDDE